MARVKKKEYEKLSDANIKHVISLLEPEEGKPITKKDACEILNISYNTTRLGKIIQEFKDKQEYVAKRKAENRGKPASKHEIAQVISDYLDGENPSNIAKSLFRSPGFVNGIINRLGVPTRSAGDAKNKTALLPDSCAKESFRPGDVVWSAKYHGPALIKQEYDDDKYLQRYGCRVYRIYVLEDVDASESYFQHVTSGGFYANAPAYDLGGLDHLEKYGVSLSQM